jgi:hypothetical protein
MWRRATNVAWWLGVSAYFGGLVTLAVSAMAISGAIRKGGITMSGFASPPLDMSRQVTGQIFGEVLARFTWVETIALGLMLVGLIGFLLAHKPVRRTVWVLLVLWVALAGLLAYDAGVLRQKVWAQREATWKTAPQYAAEQDLTKWPEKVEFDKLHKRSEAMGRYKAYLLLGMILVTAWRGLAEKPVKTVEKDGELMREV